MSNGRTTLHEVCVGGHPECLELLLTYTDQVNVKDKDGQTPAHLAAFNGELRCLKLLAEKGMLDLMFIHCHTECPEIINS